MREATGGAQTVHRALDILELLAARGQALPLSDVAAGLDLAPPTAHRLCRTLVDRGYLRQLADRRYALGVRLVPLGTAANALIGLDAEQVLRGLVTELGETANLAVLAGDQAQYVAQMPSPHSMRIFTEIGRRVDLHSTGVGKVLLAQLDDAAIAGIVRRAGMATPTPHTLATPDGLRAEIDRIRETGHALDEQEQELGVRCIAVPLPANRVPGVALSVSGPLPRMTDELVARAVPLLHDAAARLAAGLAP